MAHRTPSSEDEQDPQQREDPQKRKYPSLSAIQEKEERDNTTDLLKNKKSHSVPEKPITPYAKKGARRKQKKKKRQSKTERDQPHTQPPPNQPFSMSWKKNSKKPQRMNIQPNHDLATQRKLKHQTNPLKASQKKMPVPQHQRLYSDMNGASAKAMASLNNEMDFQSLSETSTYICNYVRLPITSPPEPSYHPVPIFTDIPVLDSNYGKLPAFQETQNSLDPISPKQTKKNPPSFCRLS